MKTKMVTFILFVALTATMVSCDFLNPLNRTLVGQFVISDVKTDLNSPVWLDNKTLIATTGYSNRLIELRPGNGSISREHTIDVDGITRMNTICINPSGTKVAFVVSYEGPNYDPDAGNEEEADYRDILIFDLASRTVNNLTDASGNFGGPTFLSDDVVVYIEFDYSVAGFVTNRIIKHNVSTDQTAIILENTYAVVNDEIQGDVYWWGKADPGTGKMLVEMTDFGTGQQSFAIIDTDNGDVLFDGHTEVGPFDTYGKGDWIDDNTVIFGAEKDGAHSYFVYDISTGALVDEFPLGDSRISQVYGSTLSPNKQFIASHFAQRDAAGQHIQNWLIVTRVAAAE